VGDNVLHTFSDLGLAETVTSHSDELIRPDFLKMTDFSCGHHDSTGDCQSIVLEEFVLLEAKTCEDLTVVL
jgi:hypothetical protein